MTQTVPDPIPAGWVLVAREWTRDGAEVQHYGPPPPVARVTTPREFMDRLPMQRQAEITAAAMHSPAVLLWLIRLAGAQEVDADHPETIAGVEAMRAAGLLTQAEADALLLR